MPNTLTMPVVQMVTPRFDADAEGRPVPTTALQARLYKYMRPLDRTVNIYISNLGNVTSDLSVPLSNATMSSASVPYPFTMYGAFTFGPIIGPNEGSEGGPFGVPAYFAAVQDNIQAQYTEYVLTEYVKYYFLGGHGPYANLSANLVTLLTAAHFDNYLS